MWMRVSRRKLKIMNANRTFTSLCETMVAGPMKFTIKYPVTGMQCLPRMKLGKKFEAGYRIGAFSYQNLVVGICMIEFLRGVLSVLLKDVQTYSIFLSENMKNTGRNTHQSSIAPAGFKPLRYMMSALSSEEVPHLVWFKMRTLELPKRSMCGIQVLRTSLTWSEDII